MIGFAAGATESTIPLIITDYTFLHERAKAFGLLSVVRLIYGYTFNRSLLTSNTLV